MTTALALVLTAIVAYLVGKKAGFNQAISYLEEWLGVSHIEAQRENAHLQ